MRSLGILVIAAHLAGCVSQSDGVEHPAILSEPSKATYQELERVVSEALNGMPVLLADDVLTKSDRLIIERKTQFDPQGNPVMGKELGMPYQFRLVKQNNTCILIYISTGERKLLEKATCSTHL